MADRNQNFIVDSLSDAANHVNRNGSTPARFNNNSPIPANGLGNATSTPKKESVDDGGRNQNEEGHQNNFQTPKKVLGSNDFNFNNRARKGHAPLVGWQMGSPTIRSSDLDDGLDLSPIGTRPPPYCFADTPSGSSGIGQDSETFDNSNSIVDESALPSAPSLTLLHSNFRPELKRTFSLNSEPSGNECKDRLPSNNDNERPQQIDDKRDTKRNEKPHGILKQYSVPEKSEFSSVDLSNQLKSKGKDSIDDSNLTLEIFDEDDENSNATNKKPKIPDGGWGWVVVGSSLVISMIADGVSFSFGLLYIEFLMEFRESKSKTAWIGSLFMAVPLLSGPIMSALVDRYGCRKMTIAGGFISGMGFVLSSYAKTIEVMYLTFGVIAGLGLGLCYVTAVVSIAYWFDKKRTLAVGLGACGTGIGTFVYAPMTAYFIKEFGWRGTCLLLAGTFFNMIVCGAVMRDPEWWILEQQKQNGNTPKKTLDQSESGRSANSPDEEFPGVEELRKLLKNGQAPEYLLQNLKTSMDTSRTSTGHPHSRSVVNLPTFVRQSEKVPLEVLESLSSNSRLYNVILENYPSLLLCRSSSDKKLDGSNGDVVNKSGVTMSMRIKQTKEKGKKAPVFSRQNSSQDPSKMLVRKMSRKDLKETNPLLANEVDHAIAATERAKSISGHLPGTDMNVVRTDSLPWLRRQFSTNTHYFKNIRVHRNSVMYRGAVLNLQKYRLRASSCPDIYRNSMTTLAKETEEKWYSDILDLLKGMVDFSMFLEFHFLLMSLSTILLFTWFIVPYFYLAEHLSRNGYDDEASANLLSLIGITNTIGMIGLGWAGDQPWMNVSKSYACSLIACGISIIIMPFCTHHYALLMVDSAFFGLFFASSFSFTPVILVQLIPLERFTTAYGLTLLCQGIGNLLGPPLAGFIFDVTGHWDPSFISAGLWIIVSGILIGIIPFTKNRKILGKGPMEIDKERECVA